MAKVGRLSHEEMDYIRLNASTHTPEQMAEYLDRTPDTIAAWAKKNVQLAGRPKRTPSLVKQTEQESIKVGIRQELRSSLSWKNLKEEFLPDELRFFEEQFIAMMSQFLDDVTPTEQSQIFLAIKLEILISRNLKSRAIAVRDTERIEAIRAAFMKKFKRATEMSDEQMSQAMEFENRLAAIKAADKARTSEFVQLEEKHADLMKALKSTREQRIKQVETSKISFVGVLKELSRREAQEREGRQMEIMKLATDKEYDRLGRPYAYDDGNMDNPILSADTVGLGPAEPEPEPEAGNEETGNDGTEV